MSQTLQYLGLLEGTRLATQLESDRTRELRIFRSCPRVYLADASLFTTISTLLAIFDIWPVWNVDGTSRLPKRGGAKSNDQVS